jgi:hypothetical protein
MAVVLWLWCAHLTSTTAAFLQLQVQPLIGGPSWLPLHVTCVVDHHHKWDFISLNATCSRTLQSLLSLQSVPGEIRYTCTCTATRTIISTATATATDGTNNENKSSLLLVPEKKKVHQAHQFVQNYDNRNLHLVTNNCWTFALMLYWHLLTTDATVQWFSFKRERELQFYCTYSTVHGSRCCLCTCSLDTTVLYYTCGQRSTEDHSIIRLLRFPKSVSKHKIRHAEPRVLCVSRLEELLLGWQKRRQKKQQEQRRRRATVEERNSCMLVL